MLQTCTTDWENIGVEQAMFNDGPLVTVVHLPKYVRNPEPGSGQVMVQFLAGSNDNIATGKDSAKVAAYLVNWISERTLAEVEKELGSDEMIQAMGAKLRHCGYLMVQPPWIGRPKPEQYEAIWWKANEGYWANFRARKDEHLRSLQDAESE